MPAWLDAPEIRLFHRELIIEHAGLAGLKDKAALEATLARPRNLLSYQPDSTLGQLAASYGYGFARNHVFADGNKRIALVAINVFLQVNGATLNVEESETVALISDLAAGKLTEAELGAWIAENSAPFDLDAQ
jgi:death-on-curing protein